VVAYAAISVLVVPPLAALGGRVPLPCRTQPDRAFAAGSVLLCALNRHYVVPDQVVLLNELSDAIERRLKIRHHTPQLILIRHGRVVWHASHWGITDAAMRRALADASDNRS